MRHFRAPRLLRSHPNFFIIFVTVAVIFNIGLGQSQLLNPGRYVNPSLHDVYRAASIHTWAWAHITAGALMLIGLRWRFDIWGRLGLALGLFLCLSRGLLIETGGATPGAGLYVWGTIAVQHLVMLMEPPVNPLTQRT